MTPPNLISPEAFAAYQNFLTERKDRLAHIARAMKGEYTLEDVQQEALIMAYDMQVNKERVIRFSEPADQNLLLSYLYQHLVRYTELHIRHGIKLDHSIDKDDANGTPHPLLKRLSTTQDADPLNACIAYEEALTPLVAEPDSHHSQASAYVHLLRHFDHRMYQIARHLLISVSHSYRCLARARHYATHQHPLAMRPYQTADSAFFPRAWRRSRHQRRPIQLAFDFVHEPTLWSMALWQVVMSMQS